ncbi:MAG TPA: hypothetical protein VJN96_12935 [Vicinamibacterales bacterium]|nr:hypothetical protein [Vicinamibacterales bacterium]
MERRQLSAVERELTATLRECKRLAGDAVAWSVVPPPAPGAAAARPLINAKRRDSMIELAFLRAFLAWETFLEDAFVLYMLGKKPVSGRRPYRFVLPPSREWAHEAIREGQRYAKWDGQVVSNKATRFFKDGRPFTDVLRANQAFFEEATTIRNAVAHSSSEARDKFLNIVRNKPGAPPIANITVGAFLNAQVPASNPPIAFLDFYLDRLEFVADQIVRL